MKAPKVHIEFRDIVTSTNDEVKRLYHAQKAYDYCIVAANEQTEGRGQRENKWHSEAGKNLTFSISFAPDFIEISHQFYISKAVSIGIFNYLSAESEGCTIKWPNDIYINGKKICGILIENSISGKKFSQTVIGIGLNLNQTVFPKYLDNAISLSLQTGKTFDLNEEFYSLSSEIIKCLELLKKHDFSMIDKDYHRHLYKIYSNATFRDASGIFRGRILGTMSCGPLLIEDEHSKIRTYQYKEVEFL